VRCLLLFPVLLHLATKSRKERKERGKKEEKGPELHLVYRPSSLFTAQAADNAKGLFQEGKRKGPATPTEERRRGSPQKGKKKKQAGVLAVDWRKEI